ncbi:hypothetical protein PR048_004409 [Dryococelus australis]|uniref:Polyprotein n=1 Tax=Dryococelus australis TaxID=614101 RepID=A0ABQ9I5D4_9NEOP|nr:hypothetical protein PR048_004409 [Dryococelus australis]
MIASLGSLSKTIIPVSINGNKVSALVDTGSTSSFLSNRDVRNRGLKVSEIRGKCCVDLSISEHTYTEIDLDILPRLCSNIIIGHNILNKHTSFEVVFGGKKTLLTICAVTTAKVPPAILFANLSSDFRPITIKYRLQNDSDSKFIEKDVEHMPKEDIIEPSRSPWKAQVQMTINEKHEKVVIHDIIRTENLKGAFANLDDVTICGKNQQENDENLRKFMEAAESTA